MYKYFLCDTSRDIKCHKCFFFISCLQFILKTVVVSVINLFDNAKLNHVFHVLGSRAAKVRRAIPHLSARSETIHLQKFLRIFRPRFYLSQIVVMHIVFFGWQLSGQHNLSNMFHRILLF